VRETGFRLQAVGLRKAPPRGPLRAGTGGALLLTALLSLSACKSAPPEQLPLHPYKVVLMPVEGAKEALSAKPGEADVPLALTPEQLETKIRDSVTSSRVFSDVVVAKAADLGGKGDDPMQFAAALAKKTDSDLILRLQVRSARMTDLGNNSSTFWSTLTWFMVGIPSFWVDDRSYDTDVSVRADLYDPDDPTKPAASVDAQTERQDLDLWDRGLTPLVIIAPPAFLPGSESSVSETLTERAMDQLLAKLVQQLRTREIPSRFDQMDVVQEGGSVKVTVVSRRRLRSLEIAVGGKPLRTWAETGLLEEKESTAERFVYRRSLEVPAAAGAQVRVIAEDEAGGREVRTLVLGGAR
jgi:hypothetical protein